LMLSLLCTLNMEQGQKLPESRAQLYDALVERELQESWLGRDRRRETLRGPLKRLLARPAEHLHRTTPSGMLGREELEKQIEGLLALHPEFAALTDSRAAVVTGILEGAGLIVERGFGQYAFPHQTFQEYLAAVALVEDPAILTRIFQHYRDSRWREVLLFALG